MTTERERIEAKGLFRVAFASYGEDCLVEIGASTTLCGIEVDGDERARWRNVCLACLEISGERTIEGAKR